MAFTVFVEGVERTNVTFLPDSGGNLRYALPAGAMGAASLRLFAVSNGAGAYRPVIGDTLLIKNAGVDLVNGAILELEEQAFTDDDVDEGVLLGLVVQDQHRFLGYAVYSKTYVAGTTLKAILQDLVANPFAVYSITLDAGQANGPALTTDLTFTDAYGDAIVGELRRLTGWVEHLTPALVLSMIEPGVVSSGITLQDSDTDILGGISLRRSRLENYANTVVLQYGPTGSVAIKITRATDGVTSSWVLPVTGTPTYGIVYISAAGGYKTVGPGLQYEWNAATKTLSVGTDPVPGAGTLTLELTVAFPQSVTKQDAAALAADDGKPIYRKYTEQGLTDPDAAAVKCTALLRSAVAAGARVVRVTHRRGIARRGQTVSLSFASRGVTGTHMIVNIEVRDDVDGEPIYVFECVSGTELPEGWLDYFRSIGGGASGATAITGGSFTPPAQTVLSAPFPLGGSRSASQAVGTTSTPVIDWLPFVAAADQSVTVRATGRARDAGVTVTPELAKWIGAAWVVHVSGSGFMGTTETEQTFVAALTAGVKYRLQYKTGTVGASAYCIGQLEAA